MAAKSTVKVRKTQLLYNLQTKFFLLIQKIGLKMQVKTLDLHIGITPGIAGGKPHVAGRRITVQNIVIWHEFMGHSADEIATEYDLSLADVYAALAYYYDHRIEIDEAIKESENFVEALRQKIPSKVARKVYDQGD